MRWFVEVSRVGDSTLAERYCVEAKAWQAALQETRKLRGDSGPLSKFSIELLDNGYRAVDPVQKIRYLVNQAPSDAPLEAPSQVNGSAYGGGLSLSAPPPAGPSNAPAGAASAAVTVVPGPSIPSARPLASAAPAAAPVSMPAVASAAATASAAPAAPVSKKVMGVTLGTTTSIPVPGSGAIVGKTSAAPRPDASRRSVPPRAGAKGVAVETKSIEPPAAAQAPVAVPAAPSPAVSVSPIAVVGNGAAALAAAPKLEPAPKPTQQQLAGTPEFEVFSSRVQEPSPEAPIVYREIACVVAPGTTRIAVEALLRERLKAAQADFSARQPGQLIQIAIFDHVFEERPLRPPLGTLAWKDWRGEPILGFPAFGDAAPPISPSLPPSPIVQVNAAPPAAAPTEPPAALPVTVTPAAQAAMAPVVSVRAAPQPSAESASPTAPPAPAQTVEVEQPVLLQRRASRPDSDRPSQKLALGRRRAGEDLISELFESMHELHFARDIAAGAEFVLDVLQQVLPCEAILIQVFDINTRNFVVVRGRGGGAERAVLHRTPDTDPLTSEIMRRDRSRAYRPTGDVRFSSGRWGTVGLALREVLCGPVSQAGRYLGLIELANPQGGTPFHETEINALDYICEQFADFVASRPVVLDPDVILGR